METTVLDAAAEWRIQLTPWLQALRKAHIYVDFPTLPTADELESTKFSFDVPRRGRKLTLVSEAMELRELLARVDQFSAWTLLFELVTQPQVAAQYVRVLLLSGKRTATTTPALPRFRIDVRERHFEESVGSLRELAIKRQGQHSAGYEDVKASLLQRWSGLNEGRAFDREACGRVKLSVDCAFESASDNEMESMMEDMVIIAVVHTNQDALQVVEEEQSDEESDDDTEMDEDDDDDEEREYEEEDSYADKDDEEQSDEESDGDTESEEDSYDDEEGEYEEDDSYDDDGEDGNEDVDEDLDKVGGAAGSDDGMERAHYEEDPPAEESKAPVERGPFKLGVVDFYFGEELTVSARLLEQLMVLSRQGVRVSTISTQNFAFEGLHTDAMRHFLQTHLAPGEVCDQDDGDDDWFRGFERLELRLVAIDLAAIEALAVSVAHSRSLRMFKIAPEPDDGDAWWPWLAYALFSRQTTHNIAHVSLHMWDLSLNSVEAIRKVLCSRNPLGAAFQSRPEHRTTDEGDDQNENKPTMGVMVNPAACLNYGHRDVSRSVDDGTVTGSYGAHPEGYYRVVRDYANEDYVEIIVPEDGVCWVHRDMVVGRCAIPPRPCHPIRHLTLKYVDDTSLEVAIELLKLIGALIERVTLSDIIELRGNELFDALFTHCPNLVRLDLEYGEINTLEWLWSQPSHRIKLEDLTASNVTVRDESSWRRLYEALGDTAHPLAQSLRRLRFNLSTTQFMGSYATQELQDGILGHALAMVAKNSRLQHCQWFQCERTVYEKYNQLFLSYDGEPVLGEEGPLPPAETLAFLSVLTPPSKSKPALSKKAKQDNLTPTAQYKITPEAIRSILAFSAIPPRRVCQLYRESEFRAECLVSDLTINWTSLRNFEHNTLRFFLY